MKTTITLCAPQSSSVEAMKSLLDFLKLKSFSRKKTIPAGLWEEKNVEIYYDYIADGYCFCEKHSVELCDFVYYQKSWVDAESKERKIKVYKTPIVIVAMNEGGYCSTGVCGNCILEGLSNE